MPKVAPSILAADFAKLKEEIDSIQNADYLHFDVMDGMFVENISFGLPVLESVRKVTGMVLDVHLMIASPARYTARFAKAGADIINFHIEAETEQNIKNAITELHGMGKKAGLTIKPNTPVEVLLPYIDILDLILVMTVEPGYGGQKFKSEMLEKVTQLRKIIDVKKLNCEIEVDGGINIETAKQCVNAGADVLVAGVDIFKAPSRAEHIKSLQNLRP
ncbi:MAG: ribulose-phosphate 3-epimerase [Oscillospiraceae bacterium]|nr:ribulose-phosphate 3-epimerase [Oscillospiraceae bacterium]